MDAPAARMDGAGGNTGPRMALMVSRSASAPSLDVELTRSDPTAPLQLHVHARPSEEGQGQFRPQRVRASPSARLTFCAADMARWLRRLPPHEQQGCPLQ